MIGLHRDMSPLVDMTRRGAAGPARSAHPVYVDLLPPCNNACPAGEDIQGWLNLAQAGKFQEAWQHLVRDNPLPAVHGRVCYHPCEGGCNRAEEGGDWGPDANQNQNQQNQGGHYGGGYHRGGFVPIPIFIGGGGGARPGGGTSAPVAAPSARGGFGGTGGGFGGTSAS